MTKKLTKTTQTSQDDKKKKKKKKTRGYSLIETEAKQTFK